MKNKILLLSATNYEHNHEEIHGIPIHIIGIGRVNAALNTYKLIQKYKPDHVVEFGSCGNLKDHKVGEVLEVGTVYDDFYGGPVSNHPPIEISDSNIKLFSTDTFFEKIYQLMPGHDAFIDFNENYDVKPFQWFNPSKEENKNLDFKVAKSILKEKLLT